MRILFATLALILFTLSSQSYSHVAGTPPAELGGAKTVKAGEKATTGSGSEISNTTTPPSRAKIKYIDTPGVELDGSEFIKATTSVGTGAHLVMTGVNKHDTINADGKNTKMDITGEGCTINLNKNTYDLTVTNDGNVDPNDPSKNGPPIIVNLPSGAQLTVPAGSSVTIKTP